MPDEDRFARCGRSSGCPKVVWRCWGESEIILLFPFPAGSHGCFARFRGDRFPTSGCGAGVGIGPGVGGDGRAGGGRPSAGSVRRAAADTGATPSSRRACNRRPNTPPTRRGKKGVRAEPVAGRRSRHKGSCAAYGRDGVGRGDRGPGLLRLSGLRGWPVRRRRPARDRRVFDGVRLGGWSAWPAGGGRSQMPGCCCGSCAAGKSATSGFVTRVTPRPAGLRRGGRRSPPTGCSPSAGAAEFQTDATKVNTEHPAGEDLTKSACSPGGRRARPVRPTTGTERELPGPTARLA